MSQYIIQGPEELLARVLPYQEIEVDGQAAIITRFESVTNSEHFEVISAQETYRVLRINGRS